MPSINCFLNIFLRVLVIFNYYYHLGNKNNFRTIVIIIYKEKQLLFNPLGKVIIHFFFTILGKMYELLYLEFKDNLDGFLKEMT